MMLVFILPPLPLLQVSILTKKVEQLRSELEKRTEEQEDSVMDVKRRHEREKAMMLDENKKLLGDVERVSLEDFALLQGNYFLNVFLCCRKFFN